MSSFPDRPQPNSMQMEARQPPKRILLFDSTLRDGLEGRGKMLPLERKLELARYLDRAGIDIIEAGSCIGNQADLAGLTAVASVVSQTTVCGLAGASPREIERVSAALAEGKAPFRLNTYTPTDIKVSKEKDIERLIEGIGATVRCAKEFTDDVQWTAMNATNSQLDIVARAVEAAAINGATTVCIADTQGNSAPHEFATLLSQLVDRVPLQNVVLAVHCHNHSGWAVENALAALHAGARQVEGTLEGIGPAGGNTDLEKLVMAVHADGACQGLELDVDFTLLEAASQAALKYLPSPTRP